jgi:predicted site-specific integrase-resolvase
MREFTNIQEYSKISGLSRPTIEAALKSGQLFGIQTESGKWRVKREQGTKSILCPYADKTRFTEEIRDAVVNLLSSVKP